ncbi:CheR family methyltransferase [Pseudosporangium ferrugineum]|uniref:Chemotaxis protein methyltransferase CheR n=1 Tax=Pseudosporangium ferrugineum TaxID=439699 RepID=A0A2T0SJG1_9ACTN|nr:CheR family methyltransferase [Pseudosporangium ferrugineum]PRY33513.1 chemotaxis protein methyltransferase CheR [Pseudosporangium ferrugineum]
MSTAPDVTVFRTVLATQLGWMFDDNDVPQLAQVLRDRVETARLHPGAYLRRLARGDWDAELGALAEDLTINETYFFRHGEQFRALAEVVLPERLRDRYAQRMLRLLSVGCSSGEEAYTLAIVAREAQSDPGWILDVLGLDASAAMLEQAARARYSGWALRETPDAVRARWFHPEDGEYILDPAIRASVRFRRYNVATEDEQLWHSGQYDVIFCRNLLMYLTPDVRESLIGRMTRSLAPGGCLFLGHTDTLGSQPEGLEPQQSHQAFYYRRAPSAATLAAQAPRLRPPARQEPTPASQEAARAVPRKAPATPAAPAAPGDVYGRALGLLRDERFEEALAAVEDALGARPAPRDLLLHGVLLAQAGRLEEAEIVCRRLLDVDGLYADAHHQLAVCLEGGAAVDVAIGHYRLAAYLDPGFAMPRLRLGLLARRRGELRTARTELERALALLKQEREERLTLFGGGFGRIALTSLCRAELDSQVPR